MKQHVLPFLWLCLFSLYSCSPGEDLAGVNNIPFQVAPVEGNLRLNINSLFLHPGDSRQLTARLFDAAGAQLSGSVFIWGCSDNTVATVSQGTVSAVSAGSCNITVTSGGHTAILTLAVVEPQIAISTSASQISFVADEIGLLANSSRELPQFTVYNDMGDPVNTAVTFLPPQESGITVVGNTISSSAITGNFDVLVRRGNDTLSSSLRVHVLTGAQLSRSIRVQPNTFPKVFYDNGVSSPRPVLLKVTEMRVEEGQFRQNSFVTSPQRIELNDPSVILNEAGYLTSVHPSEKTYYYTTGAGAVGFSGCVATLKYEDSHVLLGSNVAVNITGTWGCVLNNGDQYNYCISQGGTALSYHISDNYGFNPTPYRHPISGTYHIIKNGDEYMYGESNTFTGTYLATSFVLVAPINQVDIQHDGQPLGSHFYMTLQNPDLISHNNPEFEMARDAGDCTGENPGPAPNITLQQTLAGHTWITNGCMNDTEGMFSYLTLNNNGTWSAPVLFYDNEPWLGGEHPVSWEIQGNTLILHSMVREDPANPNPLIPWEDTLTVSSFTSTTITFSASGDDFEHNCNHQMTRQ